MSCRCAHDGSTEFILGKREPGSCSRHNIFEIMTKLNLNGQQLIRDLDVSRSQMELRRQERSSAQKVHVVGAGATLTAAYEQLRNAAEYAEEHVLLQRAI